MAQGELDGRTALVTGGSRGIGRAVCVALAEAGATVAVNYAGNEMAAEETLAMVEDAGGSGMIVRADVSDPDDTENMVTGVETMLGPIDLLVTSAGIASMERHEDVDFELWRRTMSVNLDGTFLSVMAVKDGMIERGFGRIVCIASIAGLAPRPTMIPYGTSKAGVVALVRNCAPAFGPTVRINAVAPGLIDTDMTADMASDARAAMIDTAPLKRTGRAEEIAEAALFLLSERSSFTTGQTFVADGGRVTLP